MTEPRLKRERWTHSPHVRKSSKYIMTPGDVQNRRAHPTDAEAIALAHLDSIRSIGPAFYPPDVVKAWGSGLTAGHLREGYGRRGGVFHRNGAYPTANLRCWGFRPIASTTRRMVRPFTSGATQRGAGSEPRSCGWPRRTRSHMGRRVSRSRPHLPELGSTKRTDSTRSAVERPLLTSGQAMPCMFMRKLLTESEHRRLI
jgi:hypothetical protein